MSKIAIVSDSTADMPSEMQKELDIHMVDAFVIIGTEVYVLGDMSLDEFYERMDNSDISNWPKTSQPRTSDFLEVYEKLKGQSYDYILSIHVTASLSGTLNSANVAKGMIDDIDIRIIDSQGVSANLIAVLIHARKLIENGRDIDSIVTELDIFASGLSSFLTLRTMDNLVKGGRISKVSYFFGKISNIKPILQLSQKNLRAYGRARGLKRSRDKIYDLATEGYSSNDSFNYIIAHTREFENVRSIENRLNTEYPKAKGFIIEIGIVVAVHAGPGGILMLCYN